MINNTCQIGKMRRQYHLPDCREDQLNRAQNGNAHIVAYYRLYCLDAATHIVDVTHFEADGDAGAVLKVESDSSCFARELWNQGRKVGNFAPVPPLPMEQQSAVALRR